MTLTIFKNVDFEPVGFYASEPVIDPCGKATMVWSYGIHSGWSKDVEMTSKRVELIKKIMLAEQTIANLNKFRMTVFSVLNENDWYNNQPVKMETIDKEIERINKSIEHALERLK